MILKHNKDGGAEYLEVVDNLIMGDILVSDLKYTWLINMTLEVDKKDLHCFLRTLLQVVFMYEYRKCFYPHTVKSVQTALIQVPWSPWQVNKWWSTIEGLATLQQNISKFAYNLHHYAKNVIKIFLSIS